jgi:transcription termination factor Rho
MDESDLNASAETGAGKPKKTTKRAPRAASVAAPKKTRATAKGRTSKVSGKGTEGTNEPTLFESAPPPAAVIEPVREERQTPVVREEPPRADPVEVAPAPAERAVFVPSSDRSASVDESAPDRSEVSDQAGGEPSVPQHSSAPSQEPSHSGNGAGQPGGFPQGGPDEDRGPWWKRKKDKKNKWKDKHQPHGGGPRQGGHQHPPQPPPPVLAPVHYGDLPDPARFADQATLDTLAATLLTGNGEAPIRVDEIYALNLFELTGYARKVGVVFEGTPNRLQLLEKIFLHAAEKQVPIIDRGLVDLTDKGYGFIVHEQANYRLYPESTYLPEALIKRYALKRGHHVEVVVQSPKSGDRCPAAVGIKTVMGKGPEEASKLTPFEELVPYYPLQRILLEAPEIHKDISMRAVDLLTPIGFGQRGLLVAPPRTGKTVLLQNIANSISHNFPEKKLILLLIDERPEEVTDFKRHTKGEVVSSTFDEAPESHVHAAEMVIEKARRLVEQGEHVVILLDSITRLARAYNALAANSGKIMSGGVEATALQKPKRFFGSARNIEGGGSITIIGTALIDTGSRMDEVIFEEFKGTGNMELHLDRGLSDKRIFPAINIDRSGTRKEELIYHPEELLRVYGLRRAMQGIPPVEAMDMLIQRLKKTKTNAEFLMSLSR